MNKISPHIKTVGVTVLLSLAGIVGLIFSVSDFLTALPLIIFYASITLNTYYSMRLFTTIAGAHNFLQDSVDIILVILYLFLAFNFNNPFVFMLTVTGLFILAVTKYVLLWGKISYPQLLIKKIKIDSAGVILCVIAFALVISSNVSIGTWLLSLVFGIANIILLYFRPMYRL
ncbi:MAG: hypothetical protein PHG25_00190 [Candidatus Pacebacteria bacterium]|nr:hypothetical protein [Candidatus Paceibacterota bacterium]